MQSTVDKLDENDADKEMVVAENDNDKEIVTALELPEAAVTE